MGEIWNKGDYFPHRHLGRPPHREKVPERHNRELPVKYRSNLPHHTYE
jgi:hypothetical protein